ncbi:hypothetical protein ACFWNQ_39415 [Streptomyces virginiae]|uniref:hypothetical protein n=1 Tax=Streptomyces virginiae TaxID=1961 RepID=UPI003663C45F
MREAELWVVLAWQPPGGELGSRNCLGPTALAECRAAVVERLREVLDTAFGAVHPGVAARPVLAVPPSPLRAEPASVHCRNVWRIPLDSREPAP